jgi:hypothetical protein
VLDSGYLTHSLMDEIELNDGTADRYLLDAPGLSLVVFISRTCGDCRVAREKLPALDLPVQRLCWIDAGDSPGITQRYEVFHLPAIFVVRDGVFYGAVNASLELWDIRRQLALALDNYPAELP